MKPPKESRFKVGDLVVLNEFITKDNYVFRSHDFPYGKPGLVLEIAVGFSEYYNSGREDHRSASYPYYGDEYYWHHQKLLVILVEGQKWWLFEEEIELYNKDERN